MQQTSLENCKSVINDLKSEIQNSNKTILELKNELDMKRIEIQK